MEAGTRSSDIQDFTKRSAVGVRDADRAHLDPRPQSVSVANFGREIHKWLICSPFLPLSP